MEAVLLGWVNTAMFLAVAAVLIPAGRLADIYGRKRIFFYGTILFAISSFACATANSSPLIIGFRALQGISGGMTVGPAVAIITSVFPAGERGRALGISTASVYLGLTAGPFLGGVLTQYLGLRSIFLLSAGLSVFVIALILWKLRGEWAESAGEKFDLSGSLTFILALAMDFTVVQISDITENGNNIVKLQRKVEQETPLGKLRKSETYYVAVPKDNLTVAMDDVVPEFNPDDYKLTLREFTLDNGEVIMLKWLSLK